MEPSDLEPPFRVYGNRDILKKMVINVDAIRYGKRYPTYTESKMQTLLLNGDYFSFRNKRIDAYKIYFYYEGEVGVLVFENVFALFNGSESRINDLYVVETAQGIYLIHYGVKDYMAKQEGFRSGGSMDMEAFLAQYPTDVQFDYHMKFSEFFDPELAYFKIDHLTLETIAYFKKLPLEQKKTYGVLREDLGKIGLPGDELKAILDYYKDHPVN